MVASELYESEIAFLITSHTLDIARDISGINSIMGYDVKPMPRLRIHDTYFDTPRSFLGRNAIGLRIRRIGGRVLLSMKSDPRPARSRGVRRSELESPWSPNSVINVVKELREKGLTIMEPRFSKSHPSTVLSRLGLRIIQERLTTRDARQILPSDKSRIRPLAEIDVDRVAFLGKPKVKIFEVEIEAKAAGSMRIVQRVGAELESSYSDFLKVWPHGKLVTGLAIRKLSKLKSFQRFLDGSQLNPEAFDVIERTILARKLGGPAY